MNKLLPIIFLLTLSLITSVSAHDIYYDKHDHFDTKRIDSYNHPYSYLYNYNYYGNYDYRHNTYLSGFDGNHYKRNYNYQYYYPTIYSPPHIRTFDSGNTQLVRYKVPIYDYDDKNDYHYDNDHYRGHFNLQPIYHDSYYPNCRIVSQTDGKIKVTYSHQYNGCRV